MGYRYFVSYADPGNRAGFGWTVIEMDKPITEEDELFEIENTKIPDGGKIIFWKEMGETHEPEMARARAGTYAEEEFVWRTQFGNVPVPFPASTRAALEQAAVELARQLWNPSPKNAAP